MGKPRANVKINPFEVKVNKEKFRIPGRKVKGSMGMPGVSRSRWIKKRDQSLLTEFKTRKKKNRFIDRRLGERNANMSAADKMMQRFAVERQRSHGRMTKFNLTEDIGGEEEELTHGGRSLAQIEKFEDPVDSDSDEEDGGQIDAKMVSDHHFGGFMTRKEELEKQDKRSWKEKMEDVIAQSKKEKYERQVQKDQNIELERELSKRFELLPASAISRRCEKEHQAADDYTILANTLKMQPRGQAVNKLKTEDEIALENFLKLQKEENEQKKKGSQELSYTLPAPEEYKDLVKLLEHRSVEDQLTIVDRLRLCYHQSLAEENKEKLEKLLGFLIRHYGVVALTSSSDLVSGLQTPIYRLAVQFPSVAADVIGKQIMKLSRQYFKLCGQHGGHGVYPGLDVFAYLHLVFVIFPTSDHQHRVVTPAMIFITHMLYQSRVRTSRDVAAGMFLSSLVLEFVKSSRRFVPEAIVFLRSVLYMAAKKENQKLGAYPTVNSKATDLLQLQEPAGCQDFKYEPLHISLLSKDPEDKDLNSDNFRLSLLTWCMKILTDFAKLWQNYIAFREIFQPVKDLAANLPAKNYPEELQDEIASLMETLTVTCEKPRRPLCMQTRRPQPLLQIEPKFEERYDGRKKAGGGKKQQEQQKLRRQYKQEMKGAMRELRRDTWYLGRVKLQETMARDAERKGKVKRILNDLASQEGDYKKLKKQKS